MVYETGVGDDKILHKNRLDLLHGSYKEEDVDEVSKHMDES